MASLTGRAKILVLAGWLSTIHNSQKGDVVKLKKSVIAAVMSVGLMAGGSLAMAQPVMAASGDPGYINAPAEIRKGPSYFYGVSSYVNYSGWNYFGCWTDDGYGNRWFSLYLGNQQWVDTRFITYQPSLPHC